MNAHTTIKPEAKVRTPEQLAAILRPFVGDKLRPRPHGADGWPIPRDAHVTIRALGARMVDADIRSVGPEGINRFYSKGCELIPWGEVRGILIEALDDTGRVSSVAEYVPVQVAA